MRPPWSLSFRYLVGALLLVGLVGFLYYAREALEPVVVAAFIAYLVNPAVVVLARNTKIKRRTAVNLVYFTVIALLIAIPATVTPFFFDELTGVAQDLLVLFDQTQAALSKPLELAGGLNIDLTQLGTSLAHARETFAAPVPEEAFLLLETTSRGAIWFLVIIVTVYLFLSEWPRMRNWLIGLTPIAFRGEVEELYERVCAVWMAYLRGQILLMFIVGVVFTIAWSIIGIPGALVLGVIAGLFTLIPDVGPFLAVTLAMGVALLEGSNWIPFSNFWVMVIVLVVYLVLINFKNLWLRPFIMGRMVNMNEGVVFVSILTATMLSGILGALLVVPVLASGSLVVNYLTRRVSGQPPFAEAEENAPTPHPARSIKKRNRN